ncbi:GH3 domain-containing protein [Bufo gargarizans]|uniref:GH3 domain-containing protein n=1 Tax=Bufo gargarizans TaxID=30331 RepID=UPI001CF11E5D|nr:GH3 domain-containing protein [Bufo gargarizans]
MYFFIISVGTCVSILLLLLWNGRRVNQWMSELKRRWSFKALSREKRRKNLDQDTCDAQEIQEKILLESLDKHRNTEYGLKYSFRDVEDVSSFQKKHPLTRHNDYTDYLQRTSQGEENILVQGRPSVLVATAGTSGNQTVVPISNESATERFIQGEAVYLEVINKAFPGALEKVFKFTFPPSIHHSDAGIPIIPYPSTLSVNFMKDLYSPAVPVHPTMSYHEILYTQLLFSLRDPDLSMLETHFFWFLHYVFSTCEDCWKSLVTDIQKGRLSSQCKVPLETRRQIEDMLVPDASRAAELHSQFQKGFHGIVRRLWPKLQVILAVESGGSDLDRQILQDSACQGIPLYSPTYCAAEGLCGVNLWPMEEIPQYVLCPRSVFFEFIPVDMSEQEQPSTLCIQDVSADKAYELVITNRDGLYRYRLGDVLQVTGFNNQSPIVKFLYRKSQTLNVRGERISECSFYKTLRCTVDMWPGASLLNYCCLESGVLGPFSGGTDPHYEVFVALKGVRNLSEDQRYKLDQTLQEHFPIYRSFRFKGSIGPVRVHLTSPALFLKLLELAAKLSSFPLDCIQPPRSLKYREMAEMIWKQVLS